MIGITSFIDEFNSNTTVVVGWFDDHHLVVSLHGSDALLLIIRQDVTSGQEIKMISSVFL